MEPNFPANNTDESIQITEGQLRECFGRVVYSHKTHEKCADRALEKHHRIKLGQIILSALTTTSVLSKVLGSDDWVLVLAAVLSVALLILNSYTKDYDLGEFAQKHRETGSKLWSIRESMLSLLVDFKSGQITISEARERRDVLQEELATVYSAAPSTTTKGYKAAQKALKVNEELTFTDSEIDAFLPAELRRMRASTDTHI